jgi:hypothetical protein
MLGCVLPGWLISGLLWTFIGIFLSSTFNDVKTLKLEDSQVPDTDGYLVGDSPDGILWFIQISDLHIKSDDINSFESFRYIFIIIYS